MRHFTWKCVNQTVDSGFVIHCKHVQMCTYAYPNRDFQSTLTWHTQNAPAQTATKSPTWC